MIGSSKAFIITVLSLFAGMVFTTLFPAAPYGVFAPTLGLAFSAYVAKRLIQKEEKFGGKEQ